MIRIAVAAAAVALSVSSASAATFPYPTVDFGGLDASYNGVGDPVYIENNLAFDPTSKTSGNCAPGPTPSDPCTKELQQSGLVTTMTSAFKDGLVSLTSFFFDLQGTGSKLIVSSSKTTPTSQLVFEIGSLAPATTQLYKDYAYTATGTTGVAYNGTIGNNKPYLAVIDNPLFVDVEYVSWSTFQAQNLRIDDITASTEDPSPVPLPAAGWMLLAALGGLAAVRRRRDAA